MSAPPFPAPPPWLAAIARRLPQWPPAALLCGGLNLVLLPALDAEARTRLASRIIAIQVSDAGLDCRIALTPLGFLPAPASAPEVSIRASAADYWLLARRLEDPDTLFFQRRLAIEGDTELGLLMKNTLDAIDWTRLPGPLLQGLAERWRRLRA